MKRQYYWLNASSKEWSFTSLCPGESEGFSVFNNNGNRRFNPKAYASVNEGDIALGFQSNPVGKLLTIGKITGVPQDLTDQSAEITFTKLIDLQRGITKDELSASGLADIQPLTARSGTFFPLEEDEYLSILKIIEEKNPEVLNGILLNHESTLAEKIENLDAQTAAKYAKEMGTYYFGGRLFEYRNYCEDELKEILGVKKISSVMVSADDSSMTLIDLKKDQTVKWENNNTFSFSCRLEFDRILNWETHLSDVRLDKYVHVFNENNDGLFQYLGPATLRLKETVLSAEPDDKYKTWEYMYVVEGKLVDGERINENGNANADIEKNIPQNLKGYEREAVIKARINQSGFRANLIKKYGRCCLCGVESPELLLASHIKPWKDSNEDEKGDTNNGLLLCPNHDRLFDRGLISFDEDGKILISDKLSETEQMFMNVNTDMKIQINPEMKKYLAFHRDNCLKK